MRCRYCSANQSLVVTSMQKHGQCETGVVKDTMCCIGVSQKYEVVAIMSQGHEKSK